MQGGDEPRPVRVETQLLLSRLFPGEMERVGEKEHENAGVSTYELRVRVCKEDRGAVGVCRRVPSKYCGRRGTADAILRRDAASRHFEVLCMGGKRELMKTEPQIM